MKYFLKNRFGTLYFFYQYLGYRMILLLVFSFLLVLMDSLGLTLFIPLLQVADQSTSGAVAGDTSMLLVHGFFKSINLGVDTINVLGVIVIVFILKAIFFFYTTKYVGITKIYFSKILRERLAVGLRDLSFTEFLATDVGRLQNSFTGEVERVIDGCGQYLDTIKNALFVAGYLGFAFFLDWKFSILVAIGGGISNLMYKAVYKRTQELSRSITTNNHRYGGVVIELVNHFKYLKSTGRNIFFFGRLQAELTRLVSNNIAVIVIGSRLAAFREPLTMLVIVIVIGIHVLVFKSPLSSVMVILLFFYRAMQKIIDLQMNWNNYLAKTGTIENIASYQKYLDDNKEVGTGRRDVAKIECIALEHISLAYQDQMVLQDICVTIDRNETIAIVGESGSGKTSLINLISTLVPPSGGRLLLNGSDIGEYDNLAYKEKIGYITQEVTVFNASVFDNVTFWSERNTANIARFKNVVAMCRLTEFIDGLPDKEDAMLGNNGVNISGGQKQRISIARELYREVDMLIMDEATSALDSETEYEIKESIESLKGKVTIISIAHRLSTIQHADRIFLMDRGRIVAEGDFAALQRKSSYFQKLTELQGM